MGTHCAPLLPDLFLHSYEAEFVKNFFVKEKRNCQCPLTTLSYDITHRLVIIKILIENVCSGKTSLHIQFIVMCE